MYVHQYVSHRKTIPMNNQTLDQDQLNNCSSIATHTCLGLFSGHGHKKLCESTILLFCLFMTLAAIIWTLNYIVGKAIDLCDDPTPTVAEAEELELEIEAKPDPLTDLSENLNKIHICHEALPRQQRSVIFYV